MTNKTAQFTPGPWAVCNWMVGNNVPTGETTVCGPNGDEHICTMDGNENNQANAALIAAAPELLEALRLIGCQSVGDDWTYQQAYEFIKATARKAIAKAEGR